MAKQVKVSDEIHHLLSTVKFFTNINIEDFCNELLKEAFTSELLEKTLMNFLLDQKKVDFVIRKLREC